MSSRTELVVEAAITVLAHGGARRLTHREVDHVAGLSQGSTSNLFRTREALIAAVLQGIAAREGRAMRRHQNALATADPGQIDADYLATLGAAAIEDALGPGRELTLARHALFLDAASSHETPDVLTDLSRQWWDLVAGLLRRAGATEPERNARLLLAYIDGLITDQLTRPQTDFDADQALLAILHGIMPRDRSPRPRR